MKHCKGPKRGKKPILVQNQIFEFFKMFHIFTCENKVFFFVKKICKKSKRKNYKKLQFLFFKETFMVWRIISEGVWYCPRNTLPVDLPLYYPNPVHFAGKPDLFRAGSRPGYGRFPSNKESILGS